MSSLRDSLVITIKQKSKYRFCIATMLFYTLQKSEEFHTFLMIYYHTEFQDTTINVASVASTLEVQTSAMLVLLMAGGNEMKSRSGVSPSSYQIS
jgi:hypothetical protein